MLEVGCAHEELNSRSSGAFGMRVSGSPACRASAMDMKPPMDESLQPI